MIKGGAEGVIGAKEELTEIDSRFGGGRQPMKTSKETIAIMANALVKDIPLQKGDKAFDHGYIMGFTDGEAYDYYLEMRNS